MTGRNGGGRGLSTLVLITVVAAACGGGGGGGGGGGPTMPPPPGITFTPTGGAGGSNSIALTQGSGTDADTLILEVRANGVQSLYGVAFDLAYPTAQLAFEGAAEGDFLSGAGAETSFQVVESSAGNLVVGLSQLGPRLGVNGSGLLLTLELSAVAGGSGSFSFADNDAFFPDGTLQGGIAWGAGTVQVNR